MPNEQSTAERYVAAIKKQAVQGFAKYLIDHSTTMQDSFREPVKAIAAYDLPDLVLEYLEVIL